jgi:hypothetical protein
MAKKSRGEQFVNMETKESQNFLGTEKIERLILRYSIPAIIGLLVNALYNIVDQIYIGHGIGYLGIAATNVSQHLLLRVEHRVTCPCSQLHGKYKLYLHLI